MTVFGLDPETTGYGYRVDGPAEGNLRFDPSTVVLDPYARIVSGRDVWGATTEPHPPYRSGIGYEDFDWEDDRPLHIAPEDLVVYELHVRGFTRDPSSGVRNPGTFAGLADKIPYLRDLGVTSVELMPVFEFDEFENSRLSPVTGERLYNYWGYSTVAFFAPKAGYAATGPRGMQAEEFKTMVKRFHRAGIEVIRRRRLQPHGRGHEFGPTLSFRGLDNATYYILGPQGEYYNYSGTGNTLNCNHPVVRGFILDCLRHWVSEYHIDGFRFDLAAILGRAPDGSVLPNPPVIESLARDPVLRDCKLIAEAWDAAGLYQVGSFPGYLHWSEWNGKYRDTVRKFIKGDPGTASELAARITGSADLYGQRGSRHRSTSLPRTTGSPWPTSCPITTSTTRRMARTTGTVTTATTPGTAAWKGRLTRRTSWPCGQANPQRTADPAVQPGNPDAGGRRRGRADPAGQQQRLLPGQPAVLVRLGPGRGERRPGALRPVRERLPARAPGPPPVRRARPGGSPGFPSVTWHGTQAWNADWSPLSRLVAVMFYRFDSTGTTASTSPPIPTGNL